MSMIIMKAMSEKVLTAIESLNFTPNPIARRLSTGQTLTIGVVLPYLTLPSCIERLRGVQKVLTDSKYDLVLFDIENPEQRDAYFLDSRDEHQPERMALGTVGER